MGWKMPRQEYADVAIRIRGTSWACTFSTVHMLVQKKKVDR
jgi:hypothetical protein